MCPQDLACGADWRGLCRHPKGKRFGGRHSICGPGLGRLFQLTSAQRAPSRLTMGDAFMDNPAKVTALLSALSKGDRDAATRLILLIHARAAAAGGQLRPRA